jgi:hypothetical protein
MGRILLIMAIILAIPYAASTWWRMRRARSERERAFIGRTSMAVAMFTILAIILITFVGLRGQLLAFPLVGVGAWILRQSLRKAHQRLIEEESDPLSQAKKIN